MTIKYFLFTVSYAIWLYVLICIAIRQLADWKKRKTEKKYQRRIKKFFQSGADHTGYDKEAARIRKCIENDLLLDYMCLCYAQSKNEYSQEEQEMFRSYIKECLELKIQMTEQRDEDSRCMLLNDIRICGVFSKDINRFLKKCSHGGNFETLWMKERGKYAAGGRVQ